jgi:hypothetical protein
MNTIAPSNMGQNSDRPRLKHFSAAPPADLHHFKPFDLGTALITVHKDSSQYCASLDKAAATGCVLLSSVRMTSVTTTLRIYSDFDVPK